MRTGITSPAPKMKYSEDWPVRLDEGGRCIHDWHRCCKLNNMVECKELYWVRCERKQSGNATGELDNPCLIVSH